MRKVLDRHLGRPLVHPLVPAKVASPRATSREEKKEIFITITEKVPPARATSPRVTSPKEKEDIKTTIIMVLLTKFRHLLSPTSASLLYLIFLLRLRKHAGIVHQVHFHHQWIRSSVTRTTSTSACSMAKTKAKLTRAENVKTTVTRYCAAAAMTTKTKREMGTTVTIKIGKAKAARYANSCSCNRL